MTIERDETTPPRAVRRHRRVATALLVAMLASLFAISVRPATANATLVASNTDVTYKEYWIPHAVFEAGCDSPPRAGGWWYTEPSPCDRKMKFTIPDDISQALKVEVFINLWRNRDVPKLRFRINGNARVAPNVGSDWGRTPWVGEVPLSDFRQGLNEIQLTSLFPVHVHDIAFRVYHDSTHPLIPGPGSDVTPPTGTLTSVTDGAGTVFPAGAGGALNVNTDTLTFRAAAADNVNVAYVDFIGKYEGYDIDADGITNEWQATGRNNFFPGGKEAKPSGGLINHLGTDTTTPYQVNWNLAHVTNQTGVQFKARIVDTSGNVRESIQPALFDFVRSRSVEAYTIEDFEDLVLHHDGLYPDTAIRTIELPELDGVTRGFLLGNYWENPRIRLNNNPFFTAHNSTEDSWTLSIRSIDVSQIGVGLNDIEYEYRGVGFGSFVEKPGPMVVLHRDLPPPAAPAITSHPGDATVSPTMTTTFTVVATGSPKPAFQWTRNGFDIPGATEASYTTTPATPDDNGANYRVRISNTLGTVTSNPAVLTVTAPPPWWNTAWPYRIEVQVGAAGYERVDKVVETGVNFTNEYAALGVTQTFDPNTVRVIEIDAAGAVIDDNIQYQFDPVIGYNPLDNADGDVVWEMEGITAANQTRRYHIYFAFKNSGIGVFPQPNRLQLIDNVIDQRQSSYRVETPTTTWFFQKDAGGFSSMLDADGNDWLDFKPDVAAAGGLFRGIPNSVFPQGDFHPGATGSRSEILTRGPLKTTIRTATIDGRFGMRWEFYEDYAVATYTKTGAPYWFLYEGTPGGTFQSGTDFVTRPSGAQNFLGNTWIEDLPDEEWVYVSDPNVDRSIFVAKHDDDNATDMYSSQTNTGSMTILGFGRQLSEPQLRRPGEEFTVGFIDTTAFNVARPLIYAAYRDISTNRGFVEQASGITPPGTPENVEAEPDDGTVLVTWDEVAEHQGAYISSYIVTPSSGAPVVVPGAQLEALITGLTNGTPYTFTVTAVNSAGQGSPSLPTEPVVPNPQLVVNSDDFNTTTLNPIWRIDDPQLLDPEAEDYVRDEFPADWEPDPDFATEVFTTGTELVLQLPGGTNHDLWTKAPLAPKVLQNIPDQDFEVELGFLSLPTETYQFQGFVAQQDRINLVRVDLLHAPAFGTENGALRVNASAIVDNQGVNLLEELVPTTTKYLRVARLGDLWTVRYSADAVTWLDAGAFTHALEVDEAGVFAGTTDPVPAESPAFTARFDYIFNTVAPITPEDGAGDTVPAVISDLVVRPSEDRAAITWNTDDLAIGEVRFGLTDQYGMGVSAPTPLDFTHTAVISGLTPNTTYHLQAKVTDVKSQETFSLDTTFTTLAPGVSATIITLWHGLSQTFGENGQTQKWVNILGNAQDLDGISRAYYTVNGGEQVELSIGADDRRLTSPGDFNIDIGYSALFRGLNRVLVNIVDFYGNVATREIDVTLDQQGSAALPLTLDWSTVTDLNDVADVIDGEWELGPGGTVRPTVPGYDRLLGIGEVDWTDYQVTVPITLNSIDPSGYDFPSAGPAVGMILRWPGHYDWDGSQPRYGFAPLGSLGWYRFQTPTLERLVLSDKDGNNVTSDPDFVMTPGKTYFFKMSVQTEVSGVEAGHRYTLTVWEQGKPERTGVTLTDRQPLNTGLQSGSLVLVAHHVDATFGKVEVVKVNQDTAPVISPPGGDYNSSRTISITSSDPSATIRYTVDGSVPTTTSAVYTGPFKLHADTEVRAIAVRPGLDVSAISSELYVIRNASPIQSDDFSSGQLNLDRWQIIDPQGDVTVWPGSDRLWVDIPHTVVHDLWQNALLAPRILQHAPNADFQIEGKFDSTLTGTYAMQGLIIQQGYKDFLRIEVFRDGTTRKAYIAGFVDGKPTVYKVPTNVTITAGLDGKQDFWLRVTRTGHVFNVEFSDDGSNWIQIQEFQHPMEVTAAGFYFGNVGKGTGAAPGLVGQMDYFFNNAARITPEDGVAAPNVAPVVSAGNTRTVIMPATTNLVAAVADDGLPGPMSYTWSLVGGPGAVTFANPNAATTTASFSAPGVHVIQLSGTDGQFTDTDTVEINVRSNPTAPLVEAGPSSRISTVDTATMRGTVTDDGFPANGTLTQLWSLQSGPAGGTVTFGSPTARVTTAQFNLPGIYTLRLTGNDGLYSSFDLVEVEVVSRRTIDGLLALYDFLDGDGEYITDVSGVGTPLNLHIGNTNSIEWGAHGMTVDNTVEIASSEPAAKINDAIRSSNEFTFEVWARPSTLTQSGPARIVSLSSSTDDRNITLAQGPSSPQNGKKLDLRVRTSATTLNGTPAIDTGDVLDLGLQHFVVTRNTSGVITLYLDNQVIETRNDAGTTLANWGSNEYLTLANEYGGGRPWEGEYRLVAVFDRALSPAEIDTHYHHGPAVIGGNKAPEVSAGADVTFALPAPFVLDGTVTDDLRPTRNGLLAGWTVVSKPVGSTVTFSDSRDPKATVNFSLPGTYELRLDADDGEAADTDTVIVTVNPIPPNVAPVVNAGPDAEIEVIDTMFLDDASVTDDSLPWPGTITQEWSVVSKPVGTTVTFSDVTIVNPTVVFSDLGTYVLQLAADDTEDQTSDTITIEVVAPPRAFTGLLALYGFGESSGNIVRDVSGVGAPLDLVIENPANSSWSNNGLTLTGPTLVQSQEPATKITNNIRATNNLTVEAWVRVNAVSPTMPGRIAALGAGNDTYNVVLSQGYHANAATNLYRSKLRTTAEGAFPIAPIADTELHHIVLTRNNTTQRARMYIDGVLIDERISSGALSSWDSSYPLVLGDEIGPLNRQFRGTYELLAFYNRALSANEVQVNFLAGADTQQPPTVVAGADQLLEYVPGNTVTTVSATATDDGFPDPPAAMQYTWSVASGPVGGSAVFTTPSSLTTGVSFSAPGVYVLRMEAFDGHLASTDTLTVTVGVNVEPTVFAGNDRRVEHGVGVVTPLATASDDGLPIPHQLTLAWTQVSGPDGGVATFSNAAVVRPAVTFSLPGTYVLRLTASDGSVSETDDITVESFTNDVPVVDAGADASTELFQLVSLSGTSADDGLPIGSNLTAQWAKVSGPGTVVFATPTELTTTADFSAIGTYVLSLTASDGALSTTDTVTVEVVAPDRISTGLVSLYGFDEGSGTVVRDISGTTPLDLNILNPANTTWVPGGLRLNASARVATPGSAAKITDAIKSANAFTIEAWIDPAQLQPTLPGRIVTISNSATARNVALGQGMEGTATNAYRTRLNATTSNAGTTANLPNDGLVHVVYTWSATVGKSYMYVNGVLTSTQNAAGTLSNWVSSYPLSLGNEAVGNVPWLGTYQLLAFYNRSISANEARINHAAGPGTQQPPTVNAGADASLEFPSSGPANAPLSGTATDDGLPTPATLTREWSMVSGPVGGTVNFANRFAASTTATFSSPGTYVLRLAASDGALVSTDDVTFTWAANAAPVVSAGIDRNGVLGNAVALDGTVTDDSRPTGGTLSTAWSVVSSPAGAIVTFGNPAQVDTTVSGDLAGTYVLRLTANDGAVSSTDDVSVTFAANAAPVVDAGAAFQAVIGVQVSLAGTVSDDGLPAPTTSAWSVDSGPGTATFAAPTSTTSGVTFGSVGTYVLRLTATDTQLSTNDTVEVTVVAPAPSEVGLQALYTFDEGSGTVVRDTSGVGTPLDLTVMTPATATWQSGSLALTGNSRIASPGAATKVNQAIRTSGAYTIEAWVAPTAITPANPGRIVALTKSLTNFNAYLGQGNEVGAATDLYRSKTKSGTALVTPVASVPNTGLTHVVLTHDSAEGKSRMYLNGVLVDTKNITGNLSTWDLTAPLTLGNEPTNNRAWNGTYQKLAIYSREVESSEITAKFAAGPSTQLAPTVNAGVDSQHEFVSPNTTVSVTGTASDDGLPAPAQLTTSWSVLSKPAGSTASFVAPSALTTGFTVDQAGTYVVQLLANDGSLATADTRSITFVPNVAPTVSAGTDRAGNNIQPVTLDGNATDDGLPAPATLVASWSVVSAPGGASVVFADAAAIDTTATFDLVGTYVLRLSVSDGSLSSTDDVTVTIAGNAAPVVAAGADAPAARATSLTLAGTVTDDGLPAPTSAAWTVVSAPPGGVATFANASLPNSTVSFDVVGTYVLRLEATDSALTASDEVTYTVADVPRVSAGIVALYDFAEGTGTTVSDVSGVGSPMNLTIDNPANTAWNTGSLTVNAGTRIASSGAGTKVGTALAATNEVTIEAWVTPTSAVPTVPGRLVAMSSDENTRNFVLSQGFWTSQAANKYESRLRTAGNFNNALASSVAPTNALTHVVLTRAAGGAQRMYVNGVQVSTGSTSGAFTWNQTLPFVIGNDGNGLRPFLGSFHLVAVYNRALSAVEVTANFNAGAGS